MSGMVATRSRAVALYFPLLSRSKLRWRGANRELFSCGSRSEWGALNGRAAGSRLVLLRAGGALLSRPAIEGFFCSSSSVAEQSKAKRHSVAVRLGVSAIAGSAPRAFSGVARERPQPEEPSQRAPRDRPDADRVQPAPSRGGVRRVRWRTARQWSRPAPLARHQVRRREGREGPELYPPRPGADRLRPGQGEGAQVHAQQRVHYGPLDVRLRPRARRAR